ncbi:hypothetical protein MRB53_002224 [Persea americana]|uniref:Uncharacterized protein n=1 Tax=Persea americana TaxID=3435 RepID=A0ACC2MU39_PERAE|nr:hypothetical protein MRB53_002224 [Persea americana]|eukprot:TRINITY_DN2748_c0_g2_i2.p1 TRINITY_DN2748_c0_g2~~TRINITY_DN2748_c0_g2_i2.p1  ORF type:complete len:264 (+),score=31.84 TRINITY_DN2748_c0_g2_i2:720-1511(+)
MRQVEKSCSYYMRTGACKFGIACKFHHPPPAQLGAVLSIAHPAYDSKGSSASASSGLPYAGGIPAWSLPSAPYMSNPHMEGHAAYMPVVLSPQGVIPTQRDWSFYTNSISPVLTTEALGSNQLPQRPDQPDCQFYLKTGRCKFGQSCKYHHPIQMNALEVNSTLGTLGLPLRPGQAICTSYGMYGICKYGSACKYDHPVSGYYSYSLPLLSIPDQTFIAYYSNSPVTCSPSETSPSKSLNLRSHPSKPESASFKQNPDIEAPE